MRKAKILIVEDESDVLALNRGHLEAQGYSVFGAATLGEARAALWEHSPDIILLDVLLPDGSGYDFCAEIRKVSTAPILYLTCMNNDADIIRGLTEGGDDYMTKPYNLDVLSARVHAQLRRAGFPEAGRIELPPLVVDFLSGRATLYGKVIDLSQKELQLLGFFANHAGREFSAEQLFEAIWGAPPENAEETVKPHISRLRKKLGLDDGSPFELRVTRNRGYMFVRTTLAPAWKM